MAACAPLGWFAACLALAIAVRGVYLLVPGLDSDQAIVGLMGRHILQGEFPTFFWGQAFAGTLESFLAAGLFYLLGASRLTLALSPFLFSLAFVLLTYRLGREAFDAESGRVAMLLAALPPSFLVAHSVTARANYIENLVLGTVILILTLRLPREPGPARRRPLFLLGFVAGLAWYESPQSVHYLLTSGLFLLLREPRLPVHREAWVVPPAFLAGSLPFWLYNLRDPGATLAAIHAQATRSDLAWSVKTYLTARLPELLDAGGRHAALAPVAAAAVFTLNALAFLFLVGRARHPHARLLLLFLLVTSAIVVVGYNRGRTTRYLLPLYSVLPVMMAGFLAAARRRTEVVFALVLSGLLVADLAGSIVHADVFHQGRRALHEYRQARDAALFRALEADGLTRVYVPDFWDAYRLTFDAQERIVFAEPGDSFYRPYTRLVDDAARYAYVIRRADVAEAFEEGMRSIGGSYRRRSMAGHVVFDAFASPPGPLLDPLARAAGPISPTHAATDGAAEATAYQVDFGAVRRIGHVAWLPADPTRRPRTYRVEASIDGTHWDPAVSHVVTPWPGLAWRRDPPSRPKLDGTERLHVRLPPVEARWLRLSVAAGAGPAEWLIQELFVADVAGEPPTRGHVQVHRLRPVR